MRHPLLLAAAILVGTSVLAHPAAAQKKGAAPASKPAAAAKAAPTAAPAPPTAAPAGPKLDVNALAVAASLDPATKARIAPHVAGMNQELAAMGGLMTGFSRMLPPAQQDSLHKALNAHYQAFHRHWQEADALIPAVRRQAFDAAVRQQMGARSQPVGNPHQKLPATHPKLNPQGGPVKK